MPLLLFSGAGHPGAATSAGVRSIVGRWVGGFGAPPPVVGTPASVRSVAGRWVGGLSAPVVTPPPPTTPGSVRSITGRWVGGLGAGLPFCSPAFQANAFQANAFQTCRPMAAVKKIGWMPEWGEPRLRHDPEELERRLERQRANTFGVPWYDRFVEAEQAALEAAQKAKTEKQRDAISEAVYQAANLLESVNEPSVELEKIEEMLRHAANVRRTTASIRYAENLAIYIAAAMANDEEEAAQLLLLT